MNNNLLTISQASKLLHVSQRTLRNWEKDGKISSIKTVGGHRRYFMTELNKFLDLKEERNNIELPIATYSRVSSHEQKTKGNLDRQSQRLSEYCAKKKYMVEYIIKDVGSGLSDSRTGFVKLSKLVTEKKISKIIIEHKDRLTRSQFSFIERMFNSYNVEIICVEKNDISEEEELVNDIMMLMASFSGKLYGKRSAKRRKNKKDDGSN